MSGIDLLFAAGLTPENAVKYFKSKGYSLSYKWSDVWQEQHNKAFTVTKMMQMDLLKDTKAILDDFIAGKIKYKEAASMLSDKMQAKGWWGKQKMINPETGKEEEVQLGSAYRIKKILETNANVSFAAGKYQTMIQASDFAPWWRYIDMDDNRVRFKHHQVGKLFKNAVLHYTDPFWQTWFPPNDWGCRCDVLNYTEAEAKERGYKFLTHDDFAAMLSDQKIDTPGKGWAYNPGTQISPINDAIRDKLLSIKDDDLISVLAQNIINPMQQQKIFADFVDNLLQSYKITGDELIVGFIDKRIIQKLESLGLKPKTDLIFISDKVIVHSFRSVKPDIKKLTLDEFKTIPSVLAKPEAILFDTTNNALLYVLKTTDNNKMGKIVVRVNYDPALKNFLAKKNYIITTGKVESYNLKERRYVVLYGNI